MALATDTPLTHRARLTRGLAHTAAGPLDVARGALGLSGAAVMRSLAEVRRRYRRTHLADRVADAADAATAQLAAAREMVAGLPELLDEAPQRQRLGRSWAIVGAALVLGGVAAVAIRRSQRAEDPWVSSPQPPADTA